ncbi:MAG: dihydropteroate synthase [Syntrophorhabdaceae bacterium]|nr:dihydropteroate synthase [Syntrophorhabdaceae bacterium]
MLIRERPLIMGILNVTPDSFFDGGKYSNTEDAIKHGLEMVEDGADIIDVGGESTRPYSKPVSLEDELNRVIPVIKGIRSKSDILISIDTYKARVAKEAFDAGANMVNDISGLGFDKDMAKTVAKLGAYAVIMHIKGTPQDMQLSPSYKDVIKEIKDYFQERIDFALSSGIEREKIILDPGIGFGKRIEDNLKIIKELKTFKEFGLPLLIGTSMKSFIGHVTDSELHERVEGTLASIAISIWNGADIVRVHDVKKALKVIKLVYAVMKS